jgi:hypothetical protein
MKQQILILCTLILGSVTLFAQIKTTDSKTKKNNKIGINTDRLEFGYKERTGTSTSTSSTGRTSSYSYLIQLPFVKINDNPPVEIHFSGNETSRLFQNCPPALKEFKSAKIYRKKAIGAFLIGGAAAGALVLTGLVVSVDANKPGLFLPAVGISMGSLVTGAILARKYSKNSKIYLENSFATYNSSCYSPIEKEESKDKKVDKKKEATTNMPQQSKLDKPSTTPAKFKDEYTYKLLRNDPENIQYIYTGFIPCLVETGGTRGFTLRGQIGLTYVKGIQYGISATLEKAYLDNYEGYDGSPFGTVGIYNRKSWVTNYKKQSNLDVIAFKKIVSKKKTEEKHSVDLGYSIEYGQRVGHSSSIKLNYADAIVARAGFSRFRGLIDGYAPNSRTRFASIINGQNTNLDDQSAAMMTASSIALGVAFHRISDYKLQILEGELKGIKESTFTYQLYADLLYSPVVKFDDILYGFDSDTKKTEINTLSPKKRISPRLGFERAALNKKGGGFLGGEIGLRPGTTDYRFYFKGWLGFNFGGRL